MRARVRAGVGVRYRTSASPLCEAHLLLDRATGQVLEVELHAIELGAASEAVALHEHHGQGPLR